MKIFLTTLLLVCSITVGVCQQLKDVSLTNDSGETISSEQLINDGRAKVFVFWSNYCRYCKLEMKGIRNIGKDWYKEYDAEVVFVSLETYPSQAYQKLDFIQDFKNDGIYWLHDNKMQFYNQFGGQGIPTSILFNKEGEIIQKWYSYDDGLERSIGMYFKKLYNKNVERPQITS